MPNHVLCDRHIMVDLPVVDLELQSYKVRQYGSGAGLSLDWRSFLAWDGTDNWETLESRTESGRFPNQRAHGF